MSRSGERTRGRRGETTGPRGTGRPVDTSSAPGALPTTALFLAGPVILTVHFLLVYLVAEAGCTGDGPGLDLFDPPVPRIVALVATGVAAVACLVTSLLALLPVRRARGRDTGLLLVGAMLSALGFVTVLFVGLPAAFLGSCT